MKKRIFGQTSYMVSGLQSGPFVNLYRREADTFTKLTYGDIAPGSSVHGFSWSDDGKYLALGVWAGSEPLLVYKRTLDRFAKLTVPAPIGSLSGAYRVDMTPDGRYIAIATYTAGNQINWYRRDNDAIVRLPSPVQGTTGGTVGVQWDPTGTYLAFSKITTSDGGYLAWYRRNGDTLVKLPNPTVMPTAVSDTIFWSPDGKYLALSMRGAERIIIYRREGDTLVRVVDNIPNGVASHNAAFSPDGKHLALGHETVPYLTIYRIDGETFTPLSSALIGGNPGSSSLCLEYSNDGKYLTVSGYWNEPAITVYKIDGEVYTKQDLGIPVNYTSRAIAMWTDYVEVSKNTLSFAKVTALPVTLEPNTVYMLPGSTAGDLKIYLSDMAGEEVRHVVTSDELATMILTAATSLNEVSVVNNIASRDALTVTGSKTVLVLDASDDITVSSGSATYQYVMATGSYHKLSERESMDLLLSWDSLVDGVLSSAVEVDGAVVARHGHYDLPALDQITVVSNQLYFAGKALQSGIGVNQW